MLLARPPYYTHCFGSLGETIDSALKSDFFSWFHLLETERRAERPGEAVRFRASGETFRDLCYLDILAASDARPVRMELVVLRSFLDGREGAFAHDLVKSFLLAALPDACRDLLHEFIAEMNTLGGDGETPGYQVFRGRLTSWETQTGWSRLALANLSAPEGRVLVVQVGPNPTAPNATLIEDANADDAWPGPW